MRTTHVQNLEIKRLIPYDPNFHGLVDQDGRIDIAFLKGSEQEPRFRILIEFKFKQRDDSVEMGFIRVEAQTVLHGVALPKEGNGAINMRAVPENIKRLIEGAVGEDLLIPVSLAARLAHLPAPIPSPLVFPRDPAPASADRPKSQKKAARKKSASSKPKR